MMQNEVPDTLVNATRRVMAKDGAWNRLTVAVKALDATIYEIGYSPEHVAYRNWLGTVMGKGSIDPADMKLIMETPKPDEGYHLRPQHDGLTQEEAQSLLIGHYGFKAEWGNGGEALRTISAECKMDLQEVLEDFDKPSQLTKPFDPKDMGKRVGEKIGIRQENVRQALERVPAEMEALLNHNADRISEADNARVKEQVAEYRAALADVLKYVDFTREQLRR